LGEYLNAETHVSAENSPPIARSRISEKNEDESWSTSRQEPQAERTQESGRSHEQSRETHQLEWDAGG
jgi:hypothetical protein